MASVCFYFQVHQPYRLRRYSVFDTDPHYVDDFKNAEIVRKVAHKCYLPANRTLLDLIRRSDGKFRCAFSISGTALEQFERSVPEVLDTFRELSDTGCVEFLAETYFHSLAFLYSREEFREQVELHGKKIKDLFGQTPTVFRNTELIYNNDLAQFVEEMGYAGCLAEGADAVLNGRSPGQLFRPPTAPTLKVLLKNYGLSDDIAFRFSNRDWEHWPLHADTYAAWVRRLGGRGTLANLFLDYETFGEHQWAETGIFAFLEHLPDALLADAGNEFVTPGEVVKKMTATEEIDAPHMISWADTERDLSAWLGNAMQSNALHELFKLEGPVRASGDARLLTDWRRLTTSDHFYYMCTKFWADGEVHRYFSPYESPYDSYINFMNVLDNLQTRIRS